MLFVQGIKPLDVVQGFPCTFFFLADYVLNVFLLGIVGFHSTCVESYVSGLHCFLL